MKENCLSRRFSRSFIVVLVAVIACLWLPPSRAGINQAGINEEWVGVGQMGREVMWYFPVTNVEAGTFRVVVALELRNKSALDALTGRVLANTSARRPSREEFLREHAPASEHADLVADYLRSSGFSNVEIAENRLLVSAYGSKDVVQKAFNTELRFYQKGDNVVMSNLRQVMVPARIRPYVSGVIGLQTVAQSIPEFWQSVRSGALVRDSVVNYSLPDLVSAYNANNMPPATKATIGMVTQGDMTQTLTDLNLFATRAGFSIPRVDVVRAGGAPLAVNAAVSATGNVAGNATGHTLAWNAMTQTVLVAAGGSVERLVMYNTSTLSDTDLLLAYNRAVAENRVGVVVLPFAQCEGDAFESGYSNAASGIFQAGVAQGITFVAAAGKSERWRCNKLNEQTFPAVSSHVIAVGGTTLANSGVGSGVRYGKRSGAEPDGMGRIKFDSDKMARSEIAWSATGAGGSLFEPAPDWQLLYLRSQVDGLMAEMKADPQTELSVGLRVKEIYADKESRRVPDLVFNADPDTGAQIVVNGKMERVGGTGLASALFAGFWSRVQSVYDNQLPFPAAALYMYSGMDRSRWFNDITLGSNGDYSAWTGWDRVTGLGSLDVAHFAAGIRNVVSVAPGTRFLDNAVPVTGISLPKGGSVLYRFMIRQDKPPLMRGAAYQDGGAGTSTRLTFQLSGGSGNGDVYVHLGGAPTERNYLKKSDGLGNEDAVRIDNPLSGVYNVLISASEQVRNATLVARYDVVAHGAKTVKRGDTVTGIHLKSGETAMYSIVVPEGRRNLTFTLSGGTGDGDLYARHDQPPSVGAFDARANGFDNHEQIVFRRPGAGEYFVMVRAFKELDGAVLAVGYE